MANKEVDISNGRVKSAELSIPTSAPSVPFNGAIYFNTSDNKIYVYISNGWVATAALS